MPSPRKVAINDTVLFITTSVEEGLMFPPNPLIRLILLNCLAKAQMHHPVQVSHFCVQATHLHMLLYVTNPEDVADFMERFKTESSHAINRLLGRKKRTIWCEGYDSPVMLKLADAQKKIVYLYENPAKDSLVDSIELYPGLSSWSNFRIGAKTFKTHLIPRDYIRALPEGEVSQDVYKKEARLLSYKKKAATFRIEPNAWMKAFKITDEAEQQQINDSIVNVLRIKEQEYREIRAKENRSVMGAHRLQAQKPGTPYTPERDGKRMICHSMDRELRRDFIRAINGLIASGKEVLAEWRRGNLGVLYPPGLYPPSLPKRAELFGSVATVLG
jgi:hypothetical protein